MYQSPSLPKEDHRPFHDDANMICRIKHATLTLLHHPTTNHITQETNKRKKEKRKYKRFREPTLFDKYLPYYICAEGLEK